MERKLWMDVLNIVAIIGVIILHCNGEICLFEGKVTENFFWEAFVISLCYWPVNVFFLITGANLIGYNKGWRIFAKRRIQRTVIPYLTWSLVYCLLLHRNISLEEFVENILNGGMVVYFWYFIPLFVVYLSIPFISAMVHNCSKKLSNYYIVISFISISIIPVVCHVFSIDVKRDLFPVGSGYIAISFYGYYLTHMRQNRHSFSRGRLVLLGGAFVFVNYSLLLIYAMINGRLFQPLMSYFNPICVSMAIVVFLLFSKIDWDFLIRKIGIKRNFIFILSSCTLGIYIIHPMIFLVSDHLGLSFFRNDYIGFLPTYICSLLIVLGMKKMPGLKIIVP